MASDTFPSGVTFTAWEVVLDAIPLSYQPPGHHARIQARGVAVRNARAASGGTY